MKRFSSYPRRGFTLIEISIVLVIIGLVTAAVLVGRDLISQAALRSQLAEIEHINTAVHTFRTKYGGLPGDLKTQDALNAGLVYRGSTGVGVINNNGLLESSSAGLVNDSRTVAGMEVTVFWRDLSTANLIKERLLAASDSLVPGLIMGEDPIVQLNTYLPSAKLGRGIYLSVYSSAGKNYFFIGGTNQIAAGAYNLAYKITPAEMWAMDQKKDDGRPITGTIQATRSTVDLGMICSPSASGGTGDACCGDNAGGSANIYKTVTDALGNTMACHAAFQMN